MKEISKEKTFCEMAETVFQERKEKLEAIKKHEEEEMLKRRDERIKRIAIICLKIFSESTKHTQNSEDFVKQIFIKITFCGGKAIGTDCEIGTTKGKCYNTKECSNTPNYKYLGEYLAKICDENLTYEDLGEINRYFRIAKGFYTRQYGHFEDACTETLNIAIKA